MLKTRFDEILRRLRLVQQELDTELDRVLADGRESFRYTLERGRVVFEHGMRSLHLEQRTGLWSYGKNAPVSFILTAPVIYGLITLSVERAADKRRASNRSCDLKTLIDHDRTPAERQQHDQGAERMTGLRELVVEVQQTCLGQDVLPVVEAVRG